MSSAEEKKVYVIMSFDEKYDHVYSTIESAVREAGFSCSRSDTDLTPQNIPSQMVKDIVNADILIADISEPNPNVYYELGISHTLPKKTIMICLSDKKLPFDIQGEKIHKYDNDRKGRELLSYKLIEILTQIIETDKDPSNIVQDTLEQHGNIKQDNISNAFNQVYINQNNKEVALEIVKHINKKSKGNKKVVVAICGSGAVGKGKFAKLLHECIKEKKEGLEASILPTDSYMMSREDRIIQNLIGFDRKANNLKQFERDVEKLLDGKSIWVRPYDHYTGKHGAKKEIKPSEVLIIEGIYSFHPILKKKCNNAETLMYYIYARRIAAKALKFISDVKDRSHSVELALEHAIPEYNTYAKHILPFARETNYFITSNTMWKYRLVPPLESQKLLSEIKQRTKRNSHYDE